MTSWNEYQVAIDRLLALAGEKICIYDEDLSSLKLDAGLRLQALKRTLSAKHNSKLKIALRNTEPLRQQHPLLINLLTIYSHQASAQQTPAQLAHLRDSMIIIDDKHALIRFERDQPRSKLLLDEPEEIKPYLNRFEEIWREGGEQVSQTTLGL